MLLGISRSSLSIGFEKFNQFPQETEWKEKSMGDVFWVCAGLTPLYSGIFFFFSFQIVI